MIYKGSTQIKDVYYGGRRIAKVYYGSRLVYIRWRGDPLPIVIRAYLTTLRGTLGPSVVEGKAAIIRGALKPLTLTLDTGCFTGERAIMMKYIVMRALLKVRTGYAETTRVGIRISPLISLVPMSCGDGIDFPDTVITTNIHPSFAPSSADTDGALIEAECAIRTTVSAELSTWLYPIEDGDALIIRQAYLATQTDTILEVE